MEASPSPIPVERRDFTLVMTWESSLMRGERRGVGRAAPGRKLGLRSRSAGTALPRSARLGDPTVLGRLQLDREPE